jgi:hypothetical protein
MDFPYELPGNGPLHRWEKREPQGWLPRGWIDGLILSNDGTDATNDIAISAGACRSTSSIGPDGIRTTLAKYQADLEIPVAIIKQLDVAWAPENYDPENGISGGARSGLRSSSSISNTTWHVFAIGGFDCPTDIFAHDGVDPSAVLPNGYTAWRRIGSLIRASAAILAFTQHGDEFWLATPVLDLNATNPGTSAVTRTLASVPTGIAVKAFLYAQANGESGVVNGAAYYSALTAADVAPSSTAAPLASIADFTSNSSEVTGSVSVWTDTSAQIRTRNLQTSASVAVRAATLGWLDRRGKDG